MKLYRWGCAVFIVAVFISGCQMPLNPLGGNTGAIQSKKGVVSLWKASPKLSQLIIQADGKNANCDLSGRAICYGINNSAKFRLKPVLEKERYFRITQISINGNQVSNGSWSEPIDARIGINIITVTIKEFYTSTEPTVYTIYVYRSIGSEIGSFVYNEITRTPKVSGKIQGSDPIIHQSTKVEKDDTSILLECVDTEVGSDCEINTADDELSCYINIPNSLNQIYMSYEYNCADPFLLKSVDMCIKYEYDDIMNDRVVVEKSYDNAGFDMIWGTKDDNCYSITTFDYEIGVDLNLFSKTAICLFSDASRKRWDKKAVYRYNDKGLYQSCTVKIAGPDGVLDTFDDMPLYNTEISQAGLKGENYTNVTYYHWRSDMTLLSMQRYQKRYKKVDDNTDTCEYWLSGPDSILGTTDDILEKYGVTKRFAIVYLL